jgi:hypothetical protein
MLNYQWKDSLWERFYMGAPGRQRRSVERYHPVLQRGRRRQESLIALSKRYSINPKTVAKWGRRQRPSGGNRRTSVTDHPAGPKDAKSTTLSIEEEAIIVAFRRHTLLPLDDCLYALQAVLGLIGDPAPDAVLLASLFAAQSNVCRLRKLACMGSAGCLKWPGTKNRKRSSRHIPSATSTSTSPKCALRKASCTFTSALTAYRSSRSCSS